MCAFRLRSNCNAVCSCLEDASLSKAEAGESASDERQPVSDEPLPGRPDREKSSDGVAISQAPDDEQ